MFALFSLIAPGLLKTGIPGLLKYARVILIGLAITVLGVLAYKAYNSVKETLQEIQTNRQLVVDQANTIKQQADDIKLMTEQMAKLQESHDKTVFILQELYKEQTEVKEVVVKRKKKVDTSIRDINVKPNTEEEKKKQRSEVLIDDLNGTYCELFPMNCKAPEVQ
jgi:uncharacterized protein YoxC